MNIPKKNKIPIMEHDFSSKPIIKPKDLSNLENIPNRFLICSFNNIIQKLNKQDKIKKNNNNIKLGNYFISPIYELAKNNKKIGIINHPFGAPTAGAVIEELADNGCRKIIACGTAGVLDKKISKGEIVIPNEAVRDEGTSYHYIKPDEKAVPHPKAVDTVIKTCQKNKLSFRTGKTWTTDAIFRETKNIIAKRKNKGCVTVEMEGAAFFAASKLKNIMTAQILYALDDISGPKWNKRTKLKPRITMEKVFWLAVESCFKL